MMFPLFPSNLFILNLLLAKMYKMNGSCLSVIGLIDVEFLEGMLLMILKATSIESGGIMLFPNYTLFIILSYGLVFVSFITFFTMSFSSVSQGLEI